MYCNTNDMAADMLPEREREKGEASTSYREKEPLNMLTKAITTDKHH